MCMTRTCMIRTCMLRACSLRSWLAGLALLAGLCAAPAYAAESYDNCTGFIETIPAVISTQGTWCLHHDVATAVTTGYAIDIQANNVTIDCNGFKIGGMSAGTASSARGVHAFDRLNITVRNCGIRGFYTGILLNFGGGHLVEDNRLDQNLRVGIFVANGGNSRVQRNRVFDTGGATGDAFSVGIQAQADVLDNTVAGAFTSEPTSSISGIRLTGDGNAARGNQVSDLLVTGVGAAIGIFANGAHQSVSANTITNVPAVAGTGITGAGVNSTFCRNNEVTGFSAGISDCQTSGNLIH